MTTLIVGYDDEPLRRRVCEWLRANGVDPNLVPIGSRISATAETITFDKFRLTADGTKQVDPQDPSMVWTERWTMPLRVPWQPAASGAA